MIEKFRQQIASLFEETSEEQVPTVNLGLIFAWFAVAGIIGGISPFICPSNHGLLVSSFTSSLFIILTTKPFVKWLVKYHS